jgi:hypothetical protein
MRNVASIILGGISFFFTFEALLALGVIIYNGLLIKMGVFQILCKL